VPSFSGLNVIGTILTGGHGGGRRKKSLAAYVTGIIILDAEGDVNEITKGDFPEFSDYIYNFGLIGIVLNVELKVVQSYNVRRCHYSDVLWDTCFKTAHDFE
jgi:hypothetical protein